MMGHYKNFTYLFIVFVFLFASCRVTKQNNTTKESFTFYPTGADTAKIQFLTGINSELDIGKVGKSKFVEYVTGKKTDAKTLEGQFGIMTHNGQIYVCNLIKKGVTVINPEKSYFSYFIPTGKHFLGNPANCFINKDGKLYFADNGRGRLAVYENDGKFLWSISDTSFYKPMDVFVADEKIWVSDLAQHKIHVYKNDSTTEKLFSFPEVSSEAKEFLRQPRNIFIENDKIYISDFGAFNVKVFDLKGKFLRVIGEHGQLPGQFARPKGIAVDKSGVIYVVDSAFGNVQMFNEKGQILMFFGNEDNKGKLTMPADIYIEYNNIDYFEQYVSPDYELKYIILVTCQYGSNKISVYGRVELKTQAQNVKE